MDFILFLVVFHVAIVFARTEDNEDYDGSLITPLEEANFTRIWLNCDDNKDEGFEDKMSIINKCIKQMDSKITDMTKKCYPNMPFPATAKEARMWHCEKSGQDIAESIECENSALKEMDSDESSEESTSVRLCVWDTIMPHHEDDSDEDEEEEIEAI